MSDAPDALPPQVDSARRTQGVTQSAIRPIRLLEGAEAVTFQVDILKESYDEILALIKLNDMEQEEGLRTVLLAGLGYMEAQLRVDKINRAYATGDPKVAEHIEGLTQDLAAYHSMYSALKYRTFFLYKTSQKLEFNVAGLRASERMWEEWAARIRQEHADLRAEVARLRAIVSEFRVDGEPLMLPVEEPEAAVSERGLTTEVTQVVSIEIAPEVEVRPSFWVRIRRLFRP
ncbi:MAG TPA: hypothetical protein VEX13_13760 [Chloroflexia bacterium]|nr:hypothetical protein [Chloroflexia bacterium]